MDVEFINNFWFGYSGFFLGISSLLYNEQLHINLKFIYYFIVKVYNRVKRDREATSGIAYSNWFLYFTLLGNCSIDTRNYTF